jgi:putative nucleotidyltransferase with HDIG domain
MTNASLKRYIPHVVIATFLTAVLPGLVLLVLQLSGTLRSPLLSVLLGVMLSSVLANAGSAYWMRRPGSIDIVFGDLLVWGWIRRLRTERRLGQAASLLGGIDLEKANHVVPGDRVKALEGLASALEARDSYTHGHTRRVTRHAEMIARKLGLSRAEVAKIRTAAAVHDVGKIRTPREILNKPGSLTEDEFVLMKRHSSDSAEMATVIGDDEIVKIVRHHHERLDGTGYPDGLSGTEIPLGSRIIAVADTFDAMTSSRAYRTARKHGDAIKILKAEAGHQLDGEPVEAFLSYYGGRKSVRWWGVLVTAPQRLVEMVGVAVQNAGTTSIAQGVAAVAATALVGSAVAGQAANPPTAEADAWKAARAAEISRAGGTTGPQAANGAAADPRGGDRPAGSARPGSKESRPRGSGPSRTTPGSPRADHGGPAGQEPESHTRPAQDDAANDDGAQDTPGSTNGTEPTRRPAARPTTTPEPPPTRTEPTKPSAPDNARQPATTPQPPSPPSPPSTPTQGGGGKKSAAPQG